MNNELHIAAIVDRCERLDSVLQAQLLPSIRLMLDAAAERCIGYVQFMHSSIHGVNHWRAVALLAGVIAHCEGVCVESAVVSGYLHDCGRRDDGEDPNHPDSSADLADRVLRRWYGHLDRAQICAAIREHASGTISNDPQCGALWDADRLTLDRLGYDIDPGLLSTCSGRFLNANRRRYPSLWCYPVV